MLKLNKVLAIPNYECRTSLQLKIVEAVEKLVKFAVFHVKYTELKKNVELHEARPEKLLRRFLIEEVYGVEDKVTDRVDNINNKVKRTKLVKNKKVIAPLW